jgi:hypothetical protein
MNDILKGFLRAWRSTDLTKEEFLDLVDFLWEEIHAEQQETETDTGCDVCEGCEVEFEGYSEATHGGYPKLTLDQVDEYYENEYVAICNLLDFVQASKQLTAQKAWLHLKENDFIEYCNFYEKWTDDDKQVEVGSSHSHIWIHRLSTGEENPIRLAMIEFDPYQI